MKKVIPILLCAFFCTLSAVAQNEESPLKFAETEWGFGAISQEGGAVTHRFEFRNTGEEPIAIDRAVSSCGCTTPEYSRSLVRHDEQGSVTVSFNPADYPGAFRKSVVVVSGGGKWRNTLIITGTVVPRQQTQNVQ
ncbi:MAG: DUF1573 domain-containing protein [Rikenellaceae bacterium]|jgi:hypothetical protein|nr:DUF1573 domain-containing protein [Rikenellaceae bacterium]